MSSDVIDRSVSGTRDAALLVARVLLGVIFVVAAWNKVGGLEGTAGYFTKLGLPASSILAPFVMAFEGIAGILLIVGFKTRWAALAIAIFCILTALIAHMNFADGNQLNHFLKNLAVAGGALALYVSGPGAYSVDKS